ncbi:hypothetical protein GGS21DRAFT_489367 [Xylaria nigripes]|nr:hypothetical protein GGS21DRAFT_489367 [Xylaria nigripes]
MSFSHGQFSGTGLDVSGMRDTTQPGHRCDLCMKTFKQRSSFVRHSKKCGLEPRANVRQKSCRNCVDAKSRCDLQRPSCSRCHSRNIPCVYARAASTSGEHTTDSGSTLSTNSDIVSVSGLADHWSNLHPAEATLAGTSATDMSAYADDSTYFTEFSGSLPVIHDNVGMNFFSCGPVGAANGATGPVSGFPTAYLVSIPPGPHTVDGNPDFQCGFDSNVFFSNNESDEADLSLAPITTDAAPENEESGSWPSTLMSRSISASPLQFIKNSTQTLFHTFRSWPRMLAKGIQLPPTIHFFQAYEDWGEKGGAAGVPKHIARCIAICKLWVGQPENSGNFLHCAVKAEVECILAQYRTYNAPTLLSALQSLLMLLIILIFPSSNQTTVSVVPIHILSGIKTVAIHALSTGLMLHEESVHVRPPWRVWTYIEAKRRTLMWMFFLHWACRTYNGMHPLKCRYMGRVLAPGPKWLWQATDEKTWMDLYMRWMDMWGGRELKLSDLFLFNDGRVVNPKVESWLEDADELGILMITLLNLVAACPEGPGTYSRMPW